MENEFGAFVKRIVIKDKEGKETIKFVLKTHSLCVIELEKILKNSMAYDINVDLWYIFNNLYWVCCEEGGANKKFKIIFDEETLTEYGLGYQISFFNGVSGLIRYSSEISIPVIAANFINFKNGVLDLGKIGKKGCIQTATPENSNTWCIPYEYKPTAWCPLFLEWLDSILPSKDLVLFIQAFFNAVIKRRVDLQFFLHLKGEPRTGKGTLVRIIKKIISDKDIVSSSLNVLATDKFEAGRILGKALLILDEEKSFNDLSILKKITGRDTLTGRRKHGNNSVDFEPGCQVMVVSNPNLTLSQDDAGAIAFRARTINFKKSFTVDQQVKWLKAGGEDQLYFELAGMFNWAFGLKDNEVTDIIMSPPKCMLRDNLDAEIAGNGLTAWIVEYLVHANGGKTSIGQGTESMRGGRKRYGTDPDNDEKTKLFPNYLSHCEHNRVKYPLSLTTFTDALTSTANRIWKTNEIKKSKRGKNGYSVLNIRIKTEFELISE